MFHNKMRMIISAAFGCTAALPMLRDFHQAERRKPRAYQHSSTRQRERGARQIASGMCKHANGLVRPGQVLVTEGGKMFLCRPY